MLFASGSVRAIHVDQLESLLFTLNFRANTSSSLEEYAFWAWTQNLQCNLTNVCVCWLDSVLGPQWPVNHYRHALSLIMAVLGILLGIVFYYIRG